MIERINFLEKQIFKITYKVILLVCGFLLFCCFTAYGTNKLQIRNMQKKQKEQNQAIQQLQQKREALLNRNTPIEGSPAFVQVATQLQEEVSWSTLLMDIAGGLPPDAWLVSFKSSNKGTEMGARVLLLNGMAKTPQALAVFMDHLRQLPSFNTVVLTSSQEEAGLFHFSFSCDIGKAAWKR